MPIIYWNLFNGHSSTPLTPEQVWWFDLLYPCAATILAIGWLYLFARILYRHFTKQKGA